MTIFQGSCVAIVTPMKAGNAPATPLDPGRLSGLIEFHIENKTDAIVIAGTTGESATLSDTEHCELIRQAVTMVKRRVPVIAGTGANSTTEAINLTQCAKDAGADACLLVTPYYNKPTQEGLYLHYKAVAEAVAIPQILYNVPARTACDLLPATVARLARLEHIVGVKEASVDLERIAAIRAECGEDFLLLSGDDATATEFILRGGDGVISVAANVAPRTMHDLCALAKSGAREEAVIIDRTLCALYDRLFAEPNPIPVKWALHHMGMIENGIRLPLTWLSEAARAGLLQAMREAGI